MGSTSDAARGNRNRCRPDHEKIVILTARMLWDEGYTAGQIAPAIGLSRSAVCGVAHRNDFPPRPSPIRSSTNARKINKQQA